MSGLIVLRPTVTLDVGSRQNVTNLFNMTGIIEMATDAVELWDTWLVVALNFGVDTPGSLYGAAVEDVNKDGVYNYAPLVISDAGIDVRCFLEDLKAFGVASNIAKICFLVNP